MKRRFVVHTEYSGPLLGDRFRMSRKTADGAEPSSPLDQEDTVEEFVAYFYEFVRNDGAAVAALDRVLKARYGDDGGE